MANRLATLDLKNLRAAFRTESTEMLEFANSLPTSQWNARSRATGWSIAGVVDHIGSTAHHTYIPAVLQATRQPSLEVGT